jgi:hypothetical protein
MKFFATVIFAATLMESAYACRCFPHFETKTYQVIKKTWYGKKVQYSCRYECRSNSKTETVIGFHEKKLYGDEAGNEIVCDGTIYREQYSNSRGWFIWVYEGSEWFNPKKSNSKTLQEWANSNKCK